MRPCTCDGLDCKLCLRYRTDETFRRLCDGPNATTVVSVTPGPVLVRPAPCEHLGRLLVVDSCLCWAKNRYGCLKGHGEVSPHRECQNCQDYEEGDA